MSTTPSAQTCYRHPDRPANIRCQRCGKPICPDCMREAPVGFQCAGCVKEGARETRQRAAAYGGTRSDNPALTSLALIAANVGVWIAILANGGERGSLVQALGLRADGGCLPGDGFFYPEITASVCSGQGGTWLPGLADGAFWQVLTSAFAHVEIWHIVANMVSLYFLGPTLEALVGRTRFLAIYLLSALTASATVYWLSDPFTYTLGASGAIFGLLGALVVVLYRTGGNMQVLLGLLLLNGFITFTVPNVSWQGHLGGLLGGALVTAILVYTPKGKHRTALQWGLLASVLVTVALAIVLRSVVLG